MDSEAQLDVLQLELRLEELRAIWHEVKECTSHQPLTSRRSSLVAGSATSRRTSRSQSQQLRARPDAFCSALVGSPRSQRRHTLESTRTGARGQSQHRTSPAAAKTGRETPPRFSPTRIRPPSPVAIQRQCTESTASRKCSLGKLPPLEASSSQQSPRVCQGCGFAKIRLTAQFCQQCGKRI